MLNSLGHHEKKLAELKASCDYELRRLAAEKDRQIAFLREETSDAERRLLLMRQKHAEEIQKLEARLAEEKRAADAERYHAQKLEGNLDRLNDERRDRVVGRDKLLDELEKTQREAQQQHQRSEALAWQLKTREEANAVLIKEIEECRAQVVRERLMRDSAVAEAQRLWNELKNVHGDAEKQWPDMENTQWPPLGNDGGFNFSDQTMARMGSQESVYNDMLSFPSDGQGKHKSSGSRSRRKHKDGKHHHHHSDHSPSHRRHSHDHGDRRPSRDHHRHSDHHHHHRSSDPKPADDIECPVCGRSLNGLTPDQMNEHVEQCLANGGR